MSVSPYSTCLCRTVRFAVSPWTKPVDTAGQDIHNAWAGWPSSESLGAFFELDIIFQGPPDPASGYLADIRTIDRTVRSHAIPILTDAIRSKSEPQMPLLLNSILSALRTDLPDSLQSIRWRLSPYHCLAMSLDHPDRILICQQYEFAAAHRLHNEAMTEQENRAVFGKCNNPNGHGHNYRIDVAVSRPMESPLNPSRLDAIVNAVVIKRFDHTHLNLDTKDFRAVVPSVENIARVSFDLLGGRIAEAGGELEFVKVWETEKTCAIYPARPSW